MATKKISELDAASALTGGELFPAVQDSTTRKVTSQQLVDLIAPQVPPGPTGATGPAGPTGLTGATGPEGPSGSDGTAGRHAVPILAGGISPSTLNGCSVLIVNTTSPNQPDFQYLNFDSSSQEYAEFSIPMPSSWDGGTITAKFYWSHEDTTTDFGVVWGLQAVAVSDNEAMGNNFGSIQQVADTGGTFDNLYRTGETPPITIAGSPSPEDTVYFRASRIVDDAGDTLAIDARLHSIVLFITTTQSTDD